jgi:hypothetical protein
MDAVETTPEPGRQARIRRAADDVLRRWDRLQQTVPRPVLRMLVALPWLLRRMPVPFWVPVVLLVLRRLARRHRAPRPRATDR